MPRGRIPSQTNFDSPRRAFIIVLILVTLIVGALGIGSVMAYRAWIAPHTDEVADEVTGTFQESRQELEKKLTDAENKARTAQEKIEEIREKKNRLKVFFGTLEKLLTGSGTTATP